MSEEKSEINPLILMGIEELGKDIAKVELPIFNKYLQGRIDYWKSQGAALHWMRISLLETELKASEEILILINQ